VSTGGKAQRREDLVRTAIEVIGERGLGATRVADIAARAGISPGHVLYYFDGKADIFARALRTIEQDLRDEARAAFAGLATARERWDWLLERSIPTGQGDFRLLLWMEAWERAPRDPDVLALVVELERDWRDLVLEVLRDGIAAGEFRLDDPEDFAVRFSALMDGLTIQVVAGSPLMDRERMLEICRRTAATELRG
jgi:AcrR family transcriptional regulator